MGGVTLIVFRPRDFAITWVIGIVRSIVLYSTLLYPTLPFPILVYPTLPYSTLLYPTLPYSTLPYSTLLLLYSTILFDFAIASRERRSWGCGGLSRARERRHLDARRVGPAAEAGQATPARRLYVQMRICIYNIYTYIHIYSDMHIHIYT